MAGNLTIEGATVGYDTDGVTKMINDVRISVVDEAAKKLTDSVETLNAEIDQIWVGQSADTFKENMKLDVETISQALKESFGVLVAEVSQIVREMNRVDEQLIEKR